MNQHHINSQRKKFSLGRQIGYRILHMARSGETNERLGALELLVSLPPLPCGCSELKEYKETRKLYTAIFNACADSIVEILSRDHASGRHDPAESFNYTLPPEPLEAAKKIELLPEAFMTGPIKAALRSPYTEVRSAAAECYHRIPNDIKYGGLFSDADRKRIRIEMQSM